GSFSRRAMPASIASPCHSSAKPPPLGGLPPPHGAFQEHAAHLVEWSTTLSSKGSLGACTPKVLPHSSTPLSRRTATQERRLLGVGSTALFGQVPASCVPDSGVPRGLLDHLVGQHEEVRRYRDPQRLGRLEIHDEIELGRLLDRQVGRLGAS